MRKRIATNVMIIIAGMLIFTGCSVSENAPKAVETAEVDIEQIPYDDLRYNDEVFSLIDVSLYQEVSDSGYGYYPYATITFDKTGLSEQSFYWINKDKSLDVDCRFTSRSNGVNSERLPKLKGEYNDGKIVYVFDDYTEEYKHDFSDMELVITITIEHENYGQHEASGVMCKSVKYTCAVNTPNSNIDLEVKDVSEMSEFESTVRQDGLQEEYEYQLQMYNMLKNN